MTSALRCSLVPLALALALPLATSLAGSGAARAELQVVATLPDLGAVTKAVGKDLVSVKVLATPTEDPHFVDPRPSYLVTLSKADLVVFNGLDLEVAWLPPLLVNARNARILVGMPGHVDASTFVTRKLQLPSGKVDRSMGDVHPGGNPHFGYGPEAMSDIARGVATRLGQLDGKNAATYKANADAFVAELAALASSEKARFAALAPGQRKIVVYHDSLVYLVDWLGLTQVATIEERPGIKPSPGQVASVLKRIKAEQVRVILQEEFHPDSTSGTLAKLGQAKVVKLPGGARAASATGYLDYLRQISGSVHDALTR
ncbi:MAG: zinc ABC transporter substrate-binding protein [Deltaproteobacteria bacterium]|nr:zinc ABC transporter substrate-binding protein [Deltaproteobacteria bacterium]